jgi:hypothetical protein
MTRSFKKGSYRHPEIETADSVISFAGCMLEVLNSKGPAAEAQPDHLRPAK